MENRRLVLVRHGETEWARAGKHTGRTDVPLTPHGEAQAAGLAARLRGWSFAAVLASPLQRARRTAELAGFGARVQTDPDLQEWDYGAYEGLLGREIRARHPDWLVYRDGCPKGEAPSDVKARVGRVRRRLATLPGDVLIVAHGHLLRVLATESLGLPMDVGRLLHLAPASIGVLHEEPDGDLLLERWNDAPAT